MSEIRVMSNDKKKIISQKIKALTKVTQGYFVLGPFTFHVPCYSSVKGRR